MHVTKYCMHVSSLQINDGHQTFVWQICCFDWQTICLTGQADWGLVLQYKEPNESQEGHIRRWPFNIWP